ncbi:hypothetical protein N7541_010352, partial [Penicillium brevicompactum]
RQPPPDPSYQDNLAELGFFVNGDKIRAINSPGQGPRFKVNRNERVSKAHMDALHRAIHDIVIERLKGMCMNHFHLPADVGAAHPNTPVLVSCNIQKASRIILFVGELNEDLGIFSYREICEKGIEFGSILKLARSVLGPKPEESDTALVVANPGGRIWHNATNTAVTAEAFLGRDRAYAVSRQRSLSLRNAIMGNHSLAEHTEFIFEGLLKTSMKKGALIDILGLSEGGFASLMYLKKNWNIWAPHISCIAIVNPEQIVCVDFELADLGDPGSFFNFMVDRARGWVLSVQTLGAREIGLSTYGINCFSSGEASRITCMVSRALPNILSWLHLMHRVPTLKERLYIVRGEPAPEGNVIRAMRGLDVYQTYSEDDTLDCELTEELTDFVNDLALDSDEVREMGERLKDATELEDDQGWRFVDDEEFDADSESGGGVDTDVDSICSDETVVQDPPASHISHSSRAGKAFHGNTAPYDLKNIHDIREDSNEE